MRHTPAVAAAGLRVEEVTERSAFAALEGEWEALRRRVGVRGPFHSARWMAVTASAIAPRSLRLLVAHRGGALAGVLPLMEERRRLGGVPARILRSLSDDHSQRFDAIVDGDDAATALVDHLIGRGGWDAVELRDVALEDDAGVLRIERAAAARGLPTARWEAMRSPRLPLPSDPAALDKMRDAKFRANVRRRARKLEAEVGPVVLERVDGSSSRAEIDEALSDGFALEAAGWKGAAGTGTAIACDARLTGRYRALAHAFARRGDRNGLALYFLRVGGVRKAFHYALVEDGVYYLFKPGFDPQLGSYGLGHLLVDRVARDLIARGVRELDFLGDAMEWKREWTAVERPHAWRYLFAPTPFGRALASWKLRIGPRLRELAERIRGGARQS
jgi:CelD/BcsL family acetyltransferase involved in cellulose biosynthesis